MASSSSVAIFVLFLNVHSYLESFVFEANTNSVVGAQSIGKYDSYSICGATELFGIYCIHGFETI